jgi:subtilisin family serine protease
MSLRSASAVLIALAAACAIARDERPGKPVPLDLTGTSADSVIAEATPSYALDRITKRLPLPDGTARHRGTGRGTTIYVFDGGVSRTHPELLGRVRDGFDAFPSTARLCNAHGTAVAGAAAGSTLGVAAAAQVVDIKIINCGTGRGTVGAILQAARWTANDHRLHADRPAVANWSFFVDTSRVVPEIDSAISVLADAGILVVAAGGNFDIDACKVWPSLRERVLVVGASTLRRADDKTLHDVRTPNTAWGPCVDVYAPGDSVPLPAIDRDRPATQNWTGTSMAAGYVSGAAALLLEAHPSTPPQSTIRAIALSATPGVVDERRPDDPNAVGRLLYIGLAAARVAEQTSTTIDRGCTRYSIDDRASSSPTSRKSSGAAHAVSTTRRHPPVVPSCTVKATASWPPLIITYRSASP